MFDVDVLVVGAGPVGLIAAVELVSRGLKVEVIDSRLENAKLTKASAVQRRTLELLPKPVVEQLHAECLQLSGVKVAELNGMTRTLSELASVSLEDSDPVFSGMVVLPQWKTEDVLFEHLKRLGGSLNRGWELVDLDVSKDVVRSVLKSHLDQKRRTVTARYVIGCDGTHSTVRKLCGITYEGSVLEDDLVAFHAKFDRVDEAIAQNKLTVVFSTDESGHRQGMCFSTAMPGGGYLVVWNLSREESAPLRTGETNRHGRQILRKITADDAVTLLDGRWMPKGQVRLVPGSCEWVSTFTINSRQASEYSYKGRVFLAGDSAHCHSPLGGQGQNLGMQDAICLCWKLAAVVKGEAKADLLQTYCHERRELERRALSLIEQGTDVAFSRSPGVAAFRRVMLHLGKYAGEGRDRVAQSLLGMTSHSYAGRSALSFEHWERPPLVPVPWTRVIPFGGYRRRQNIFRGVAWRTRAGDRLPNLRLEKNVPFYPRKDQSWLLLLVQGENLANEEMSSNLVDVDVLSASQLRELGASVAARVAGYVNLQVHVVPSSDIESQDALGTRAQCLFLVRPDGYVGLRSEPLRSCVVLDYLIERANFNIADRKNRSAFSSSAPFDWAPVAVFAFLATVLFQVARSK